MASHSVPARRNRLLLALLPLAWLAAAAPVQAGVVISQVFGGNGGTYANDYVELFNNGASAVDVTGWSIQYASATGTGNFSGNGISTLTGSVPAGRYLLVKLGPTSTSGAAVVADINGSTATNLSGSNGKVVLVNQSSGLACNGSTNSCAAFAGQIVDLVGYGSANYFEGTAAAPALTSTTALLRAAGGCTDSGSNSSDFSVGTPAPRNSSTPAVDCGTTGGGGGTPAPLALSIPAIQGSTGTSPHAGKSVITSGVVTRLTNNGFFMQALVGDNDPATSDGIFVFTSSAPGVQAGHLVQVTATVTEFATGGGTVTELTAPAFSVLGTGYSIAPTPVTLPVAGGLERFEGMLVTLAGPLTVNQNFFQARYGQLTLSAGGRLETPTNRHRPGSQAQALAADNAARRIVLDDGSSLQNVNPTPYTGPTGALRAGDLVGAITGVIDWGPSTSTASGPGDYRILPLDIAAVQYGAGNPRPAVVPAVGGNVKVASFNVLNYFTTFTNGQTADGQTQQSCTPGVSTSGADCRGADSLAEFQRQQAKIVAAIAAIDADALGLMEIQNNAVAAQNLVAALNARMGAGTYAVAPGAAAGRFGTDAIKTTILYKPARLAPVGNSVVDTSAVNNRPTLAQTFATPGGTRFMLVVNHLKSKGSCPAAGDPDAAGNVDSGDGQGCWNALRSQQAAQLRTFVGQLQADANGSADVLLIGDFNAYAQEDPIAALTSSGFVDQIGRFQPFGYSYVFDGAAGRLDHAIATATLSPKVSGATHWHINADESPAHDYNQEFKQPACATCAPDPYAATVYRASDHDPVVLGLNLYASYLVASGTSYTGTAGDDHITVPAGRRTVTGGSGRDQFAFTADYAGGTTLSDFTPGQDLINLKAVLQALRIGAADPWAAGYLGCARSGTSDAVITIDPDAAGPAAARAMVLLKNQSCSAIGAGSFVR